MLIAAAFIALAAFIGLAVDAGILFAHVGHLRRAVDAASLAAANQFREGRSPAQLSAMAFEFLELNGLSPSGTVAKVCDLGTPGSVYDDPSLCPGGTNPPTGTDPPRKYVRVEAELPVWLAFLPIIGWDQVTIRSEAISEAASVDLVLVIDNSGSMAFDLCDNGDDDDGDGVTDDCNGYAQPQVGPTSDADADLCNAAGTCEPFESVRTAALNLVDRMYFPYDRMSVVTFSTVASDPPIITLEDGSSNADVKAAINSIQVATEPGNPPCTIQTDGDPRGCTSTNTAEGLIVSGNQFGVYTREEAVWIVILLSDGAANAYRTGADVMDKNNWLCPGSSPGSPTWAVPLCRDPDASTRHPTSSSDYDVDDAARDSADFVGCPDSQSPQPAMCAAPGQGAVIFTIGLGKLMWDSKACDPGVYPPGYPTGCDPDLGEKLLRYVAAVGDDGDPATDPCDGIGTAADCGNYYFSPSGPGLLRVFEAIASRIFTRITH